MTCAIGAFTGMIWTAPPLTLAQMRSQIHPDDLSSLDAAFAGLGRAGGNCRTEYRLAPGTDQEHTGRERWVAIEGAVVRVPTADPCNCSESPATSPNANGQKNICRR